jgi:hypothetical protein
LFSRPSEQDVIAALRRWQAHACNVHDQNGPATAMAVQKESKVKKLQ